MFLEIRLHLKTSDSMRLRLRCFVEEANGFMFFKSKPDLTILFQNQIQIEDDLKASKDGAKPEHWLMTKSQTSCNDRSSVSIVVTNMYNDPIVDQQL